MRKGDGSITYQNYFQILEAISLGYTKVVEIANYSYLQAKDVSSYLSVLEDIGFVRKEKLKEEGYLCYDLEDIQKE